MEASCRDRARGKEFALFVKRDGRTRVVALSPAVGYASLTLHAAGQPYIDYYALPTGNLRVAHYVGAWGNCGPGNAWRCDLVDDGVYAGMYSSIALDTQGHPGISYMDYLDLDLRYALWGYTTFLTSIGRGW